MQQKDFNRDAGEWEDGIGYQCLRNSGNKKDVSDCVGYCVVGVDEAECRGIQTYGLGRGGSAGIGICVSFWGGSLVGNFNFVFFEKRRWDAKRSFLGGVRG